MGPEDEEEEEAVLLVTHGACSNIIYEVLTGRAPAAMATVGSFFLLERCDDTTTGKDNDGPRWRDVSGGTTASTDHITEKGSSAH